VDIETAPILGYVWGLWDQNIALNQIHTDWHILSWSAKWLGDAPGKTMYMDQRDARDIEDDSKILKVLWKLLDEADIIITQNGKAFDQKKINARFVFHGMQPPSSYRHIDTVQIARKHFGFTSNKLEYMTKKLCKKFVKSSHKKFSGFELWRECLNGNLAAWNEMRRYNKYDVLSLEELYYKLAPWDSSINFSVYHGTEHHVCSCGSREFKKRGFFFTNRGKFQRYKCKSCGAETRDRKKVAE
jgi:DNA polymerase elongation subunit (family B)